MTFAGKPVTSGEVLIEKGDIETGPDGQVKLFLHDRQAILSLTPASKVSIGPAGLVKNPQIWAGLTRWIVKKSNSGKAIPAAPASLILITKTAVMGVRGTDFIVVAGPLLEETEVLTFDGHVDLASRLAPKGKVQIKKGQWGGVGGRFGQEVRPPMDLPANVLEHFNRASRMATKLKAAKESEDFYGELIPDGDPPNSDSPPVTPGKLK